MGKILVTLGGVLVVLFFAALVAPYFIDWNHYKPEIESRARAFFGRTVNIDGQITVRLLPQPVLRLHGVRIGGAAGGRFFTAEAVELRHAMEPLLRRNIKMTHIELVRPVLTLIRGENGAHNWKPDAGVSPLLAESDRVSVQNLHIQDGRILYRDKIRQGVKTITKINADLNAMSLRGPFKMAGVFGEKASDFKIATSRLGPENGFRLTGRVRGNFGDGRLSGQFQDIFEAPSFQGKIKFFRKKSRENPIDLNAEARIVLLNDVLTFEDIAGSFGEGSAIMRFKGALSLALKDRPRLKGRFSARRADLDGLLGLNRGQGAKAPWLERLWARRAYPAFMKTMESAIDIQVSGGLIGGKSFSDLDLKLESGGNGLRLKKLNVVLPGQTRFEITGQDGADGVGAVFEGAIKLDTPDLRIFLNWADLEGVLVPARGGVRLSLASRFRFAPGRLEFIESSGRLGEAGFEGSFVHNLKSNSWKLKASIDTLNLDHYFTPVKGTSKSPPLHFSLLRPSRWVNRFPTLLEGERDMSMKIGRLTLGARTYSNFEGNLRFNNGDLAVHRIVYSPAAGERVKMSGNIADLGSKPQSYMQINLDAPSLAKLIPAEVLPDLPELESILSGLGAARLDLQFTGVEDAKQVRVQLRGSGMLAGSTVKIETGFSGVPERVGDGQISWKLKVENSSATALLDQLHIPKAGAIWEAKGEKSLFEWKGKGSINLLLPFSARLHLPGASLSLMGTIEKDNIYRFSDVRLNLKVEDSARLRSRLTGRPVKSAAPVPLTLTASLDGGKDALVIAGASGAAGGAPYNAFGRIKLDGDHPEISLNLKPGRFDLPLFLGVLFDIDPGAGEGERRSGFSSAVLDVKRLHDVLLDLYVETPQLRLGRGLSLKRAILNLHTGSGRLEIRKLSGNLLGADLRATVRLEDDGNGILKGRSRLALAALPLESVFQGKGGREVLRGMLSGEVELQTGGRSLAGLISALSGSGKARISEGQGLFPDLFATSLVTQAAQNAGELEKAVTNSIGWRLAAFKPDPLSLRIRNGFLYIGDTPFAQGAGKGVFTMRASLSAGSLDAKWQFPLPDLEAAPRLGISYSGPFGALVHQIDFGPLKRFVTRRRIEREVEDTRKAGAKATESSIPAGLIKQKVTDLPGLSGAVSE